MIRPTIGIRSHSSTREPPRPSTRSLRERDNYFEAERKKYGEGTKTIRRVDVREAIPRKDDESARKDGRRAEYFIRFEAWSRILDTLYT